MLGCKDGPNARLGSNVILEIVYLFGFAAEVELEVLAAGDMSLDLLSILQYFYRLYVLGLVLLVLGFLLAISLLYLW